MGQADRRWRADRQPDRASPSARGRRARHGRFRRRGRRRWRGRDQRGSGARSGNVRRDVRRERHRQLESVLVDGSVDAWGRRRLTGSLASRPGAYVTGGYGRSSATGTVNVLSFRYTAAGVFDTTWATTGMFEKDLTGDDDRARNMVVLPDDRCCWSGSAAPAADNVDGMIMILTANGALDTTFNTTGYKIYKFDATSDRSGRGAVRRSVVAQRRCSRPSPVTEPPAAPSATAERRRRAGDVAARRDRNRVRGGRSAVSRPADDRFWAVTFDDEQQDRRRRLRHRAGRTTAWRWRASTPMARRDADLRAAAPARPVNATVGGNLEEARGVVVQSDGKIVIGGSAEH